MSEYSSLPICRLGINVNVKSLENETVTNQILSKDESCEVLYVCLYALKVESSVLLSCFALIGCWVTSCYFGFFSHPQRSRGTVSQNKMHAMI